MRKLFEKIFGTKQDRCAKRGHQVYGCETLSETPLPDHPHNNDDFEIFSHTCKCNLCGAIYVQNFSHCRGGVEAFLKRG